MAAYDWFAQWIVLMAVAWNLQLSSAEAANRRAVLPNGVNHVQSAALLLSLQEGAAGERALGEWAKYIRMSDYELPPVWVLVSSERASILPMLQDLAPAVQVFFVDEDESWATVISNFQAEVCLGFRFVDIVNRSGCHTCA